MQILEVSEADFEAKSLAFLSQKINVAVNTKGHCIIGLSGGSTPGPIYTALGASKEIDWENVWIYLADERYVPASHPDSNQKMIRETLLMHAAIPEDHILFPDCALQLDECILQYEQNLRSLFQKGSTDILVLGMGEDGHTASLFPPVSDDAFGNHLIIHTTTEHFAVRDRISITIPVLEKSSAALLLLKGEKKKHVLEKMQKAKPDLVRWPLQAVMEKMTVIAQW